MEMENMSMIRLGKRITKGEDGKVGVSDKVVALGEQARMSNLMVLSAKNSGKTQFLIPLMVQQDLKNKDAGMTIVVGKSEIAYDLYAMAKRERRKVQLLKPSCNFEVLNYLLYAKTWDYDRIDQSIISYREAIRKKEIVIIDMEHEYYSIHSVRAVDMLLMQLQSDMMDTEHTGRRKHYVYIDDAQRYIDFIGNLLEYGDSYNISTTLFFQSRSQFKIGDKDYSTMINNNVRNTILLQGLSYEDARYYAEYLYPREQPYNAIARLLNSHYGQFTFCLLKDGTFERSVGTGQLLTITQEDQDAIHRIAVSARRKLLKEFKQTIISKRMQLFDEKEALNQLTQRMDGDVSHDEYLDAAAEMIQDKSDPVPDLGKIREAYMNSDVFKKAEREKSQSKQFVKAPIEPLKSANAEEVKDQEPPKVEDQKPVESDQKKRKNDDPQPEKPTEKPQDGLSIIPINDEPTDHAHEDKIDEGSNDPDDLLLPTEGMEGILQFDDPTVSPELPMDTSEVSADNMTKPATDDPASSEVDTSVDNDLILPDVDDVISSFSRDSSLAKEQSNSNATSKGFDLESCELIIGGKLETNIPKAIKSSRPIRIKMPYQQMRNEIYKNQFSTVFNDDND